MIKDLTGSKDDTILEIMRLINENALGVCFIVDKEGVYEGVVTDGDIRRAILNKAKLDSPVNSIVKRNSIFGKIDDSSEVLIKKINDSHGENSDIEISIDGGMNETTISEVKELGADAFVVCSVIARSNNAKDKIKELKNIWSNDTNQEL